MYECHTDAPASTLDLPVIEKVLKTSIRIDFHQEHTLTCNFKESEVQVFWKLIQ